MAFVKNVAVILSVQILRLVTNLNSLGYVSILRMDSSESFNSVVFLKTVHIVHLTFSPAVYKGFLFLTSLPTSVLFCMCALITAILTNMS